MDYLSFDLEPPQITLDTLRKFPFEKLSFNCITYEHDAYRQWGDVYAHRDIFKLHGYDLVGADIRNGPCTMEEWYIHGSCSKDLRDTLRTKGCEAWEFLLDL